MLKNKKIMAISAVAAVLIGCTIFSIEKKAVTYEPTEKVYVATTNISPGSKLNSKNSKIKNIKISDTTSDVLKSSDNITKVRKIVKSSIYKGEYINKNRLVDENDPQAKALKIKADQVEFSINTQLLDNYAGTYREGDLVTLDYTPKSSNSNQNPKTVNLVDKIKVLGAIDSEGKFLKPGDENSLATGISFVGTRKQMLQVANAQDKGTFKIGRLNPGTN